MKPASAYANPADFRRALTDALRMKAANSKWTLAQLQRHLAYDRLLQRLYETDEDWIIKGAVALIARDIGVRATLDLDVFKAKAIEVCEAELRTAATLDLGDWFSFRVGPSHPLGTATQGRRLQVSAYIEPAEWVRFSVDLVGQDVHMTGQVDTITPLVGGVVPGLGQHHYRAYPLVDHISDKIVATFQRYGAEQLPSTRFRDLIDLMSIATTIPVGADLQRRALRSEAARRGVTLPRAFVVPNVAEWRRGFERESRRLMRAPGASFDEALFTVGAFVDPLLQETATGSWDPRTARWR